MALEKSTFEGINPSRFTTFTFPNPLSPTSLLRIAVLDSPTPPPGSPRVAAMSVPSGRESDWLFSSHSGHLHLLLASPSLSLSRLILFGNHLPEQHPCRFGSFHRRLGENDVSFEVSELLRPLFLAVSPKSSFERGIPDIPILSYDDNVVSSVVLGVFVGPIAGEMLVEDVEIEDDKCLGSREFRRRLRFKRMPNLVQTQIRIVPTLSIDLDSNGINDIEFSIDLETLVHPYLAPMVASLGLVGGCIEDRIAGGLKPRALCLGVGGGALVSFLMVRLGFEVVGVEADGEVLRVGRELFGLEESDFTKLYVGDAMEFLKKESGNRLNGFDVVMVDLDSCDLSNGSSAPPLEFRTRQVLLDAQSVLADNGILVVNVVPQSADVYEATKGDFREVFGEELYEIDVGNGENFVLIVTTVSPTLRFRDCNNSFADKLRMAISGAFMDSIKKI